jgi:predicted Zn-dependent peptidase
MSVYTKTLTSLESCVQNVSKSITREDVDSHIQRKINWLMLSVDDIHHHSRFVCEMYIDEHCDSIEAIVTKFRAVTYDDVQRVAGRLERAVSFRNVFSHP